MIHLGTYGFIQLAVQCRLKIMSIQIKTINLVEQEAIIDRDVNLNGEHVQSVNIYQTDGSFVTAEPFNNRIIWYPQNPNNVENTILGKIQTFDSFAGYGYLYFPLDARFDYARRILWVADSGNMRVLKVDINTGSAIDVAENGYFVTSIAVDINDGSLYVKSIKNSTTGIIQHYSRLADFQESFEFSCNYDTTIDNIADTYSYIFSVPLPSSMVFDHVRKRLWWVGNEMIYMADTINRNIVPYSMASDGFGMARSVDVDFASGNAFIIAKSIGNNMWHILQAFRDNNAIVSTTYVEKQWTSSRVNGV